MSMATDYFELTHHYNLRDGIMDDGGTSLTRNKSMFVTRHGAGEQKKVHCTDTNQSLFRFMTKGAHFVAQNPQNRLHLFGFLSRGVMLNPTNLETVILHSLYQLVS